jgi:hypothetical protein
MVLPDRDAQQLNHALDANLAHPNPDLTGPAGDLLGTFHRLQAMNAQTTAGADLKSDIWSTMMSASTPSLAAMGASAMRSRVGEFRAPLQRDWKSQHRPRSLWLSIAVILVVTSLIAASYLPGREPDSPKRPSILAPTLAQASFVGPDLAKCTTSPREPGSVEALAGQQATTQPFLPRSGNDPAFESIEQPALASKAVDGGVVLAQTEEVSDPDPGIEQFLAQLYACSPYGMSNFGVQHLDSPYFALFTDDFFRREFSGYREAGVELRATGPWVVDDEPVLIDTRKLGDRLLLILQGRNGLFDLLVIKQVDGNWRVDEVGRADMPPTVEWDKLPIATPSPTSGSYPPGPYEQDILLSGTADIPPPDASDSSRATYCDQFPEARGLACGWYVGYLGPYRYTELPPNVDFTLAFVNVASIDVRVEIQSLGVSLEIPAGTTQAVLINGDPGIHLGLIYEGGASEPTYALPIVINEPGDIYPMG